MRDIATTTLSGNLTRDVELRALPSGADVARLRVATTTRRRNGEEWVDKTNYFTVEVYGAQARNCAQYLHKGSRVFVDAELDWREWTDQQNNKREAVTFKARQVLFEGGRTNTARAARPRCRRRAGPHRGARGGSHSPPRTRRRPRRETGRARRPTTCRSDGADDVTASRVATRSMICARFSERDEWAAEIIRDRDLVQREIARVTKTARPAVDGAAKRSPHCRQRDRRGQDHHARDLRGRPVGHGHRSRRRRSARAGSLGAAADAPAAARRGQPQRLRVGLRRPAGAARTCSGSP